ncbi:ABC transporter permease [Sedimentitalea todarodis]|uniref:Transport permease protein n=1 Tax=Sedimentitalea todarodis TaxID=1631240 RepID=A0ABU3VKB5_9RHOB|nr:ABC transporter permease [Sedimentitalea todarodis]MDU9006553.1 ABC transporter permease [Sedimentitalea todarodis]
MSVLPPARPAATAAQPAPALKPAGGRRFAAGRTILALILREMSTRYGRTPGGYIWSIFEPLAAILFLSVGFSLVMRSPSLGTSFLLFYATGYMPFHLYQSLAGSIAAAIRFSRPLLQYPAVTWLDSVIARFLLNSLTGILVTILLLAGIIAVVDAHTTLNMPPIIEALGMAMLLGAGVGTVNCAISGLFPIWEVIWSILTRPLFIASGIFFLYDTMPPLAQDVLWYNPLIHIVGRMRSGFYPTYTASYVEPIFVLSVSLILLAVGLLLLGRYHRDILNL